jgi:nucleotide-binding universal stress UspA family protein
MTEQERLPIVVGVDGFETGRRALDWALREAQVRRCAVQVVHAWVYEPMADFRETSSQQLHQESLAMLRREVERATSGMTNVPPITQNSVRGDPASVLLEVSSGAAMLVVGRHQGGVDPAGAGGLGERGVRTPRDLPSRRHSRGCGAARGSQFSRAGSSIPGPTARTRMGMKGALGSTRRGQHR